MRVARAEAIGRQTGRPAVCATGRVFYAIPEHKPVFDVLHCIREGVTLDAAGRALAPNAEAHLRSDEAMRRRFADHLDWVDRSGQVAGACRFSLRELKYRFPCELEAPAHPGETPDEALRRLATEGARGLRVARGRAAGRPGADRQGARPHRVDRRRPVFPERARHRRDRARQGHPLPGAWERRQQRRLLLPRRHGGRPRAREPALRALPLRRAARAAGHRRRLRARAARGGDPGHLRKIRARPRRDGERGGHLVPRQERAARGGQGVRAVASSRSTAWASSWSRWELSGSTSSPRSACARAASTRATRASVRCSRWRPRSRGSHATCRSTWEASS